MQKHFKYFDSIPAMPKIDMILNRLGYRKNKTALSEEQMAFLENAIEKGMSLCHPKGLYRRFKIENNDGMKVTLENKQLLESMSLSKLLENSSEIALIAATVGSEAADEVSKQMKEGDPVLGIIIDSTASYTADAAVEWIRDFVNKTVKLEGKNVTKHRYSPGFKDFELSNQKLIYDMLELSKLGLELTDKYMLIPEKSVIAILGIKN